ncbi:MAG: GAF domain-containing protein, partial [Chloroflexota bacterium]
MKKAISSASAHLDPDAILERFLSTVKGVVPFDSATLSLVQDGELLFYDHVPYGDVSLSLLLERVNEQLRHSPLLHRVIDTLEPLAIEDVRADPEWQMVEGLEYVRAWVAVPLVAGEDLVGILMLDSAEVGTYGEHEVWLISTLASHASLALQNSRLHAEVQNQMHELTTLYEASAAISAELDRDTVLRTVVKEMVRALDVVACAILVGSSADRLEVVVHDGTPATSSAGAENGSSAAAAFKEVASHPTV